MWCGLPSDPYSAAGKGMSKRLENPAPALCVDPDGLATERSSCSVKVARHQGDPIHTQSTQPAARNTRPSTSPRRDHLRAALPATVDLLYRRRADLIGDGTIGDYVALHWLEWNGGALRLTETGTNICDQIKAEARLANPVEA